MMEKQHFLHQQHPLKRLHIEEDRGELAPKRGCAGCDNNLIGWVYTCDACEFYLHEYCANLPQETKHFFHSCSLFLQLVPKPKGEGATVGEFRKMTLSYRCEVCNFEMDAMCGQFQSISYSEEGVLHFSHHHPLRLSYEEAAADHHCNGCHRPISEQFYACHSCRYYLDKTCASLPRMIRHFFHTCPLFLEIKSLVNCDACYQVCDNIFVYHCTKCNFNMHAKCCQFQGIDSKEEGILHSSHHHPLILGEAHCYCNGCEKPISNKAYGCKSCRFYLEESCAKLPCEIQHFFHPCNLFLKVVDKTICDACNKHSSNILVYHCQKCDFSMHVECTNFQPINSEGRGARIQDSPHEHPLQLFGAKGKDFDRKLYCNVCGRRISGQTDYAACELCLFYIHKSCMDLPWKIQHHCHPCPLILKYSQRFRCNTCLADKLQSRPYQCEKCDFYMDVKCALSSQEIVEGDQVKDILHFCHHHPLKVVMDHFQQRKLKCQICTNPTSGVTYGCKQCYIYLHKSCLDVLPQSISKQNHSLALKRSVYKDCSKCDRRCFLGFYFGEIPFNRRTFGWCISCALEEILSIRVSPSSTVTQLHFHPCFLTLKLFSTFTCNACFSHCHTHAYYCDQCDFYVGIKCAQISMQSTDGEKGWIRHFCHWHPLQHADDVEMSTISCKICGSILLEPSYFCKKCNFYIHGSCMENLPLKIEKHYFNCTLVFLTTSLYRCIACQKEDNSSLTFRSIERGFKLCIKCVLWPKNKLSDDGTFTSIHHWHQLALVKNLEQDIICMLCKGKGLMVMYYCSQCDDYFHKSCAELPLEIKHPLHQHPITLVSTLLLPKSNRICSLCMGDLLVITDGHHSGIYHCKECSFQLDKKCVASIPSIQYQDHPHLLTVVEHMYGQEVCKVCSDPCPRKNDFNSQIKESNIAFRCAPCKFTLHLGCGPLPCKIKHPCHVHSLLLEDFYVDENDTDKFACHVCEDWRNPRLPVYRCMKGCPMICEITCVISEVLPKLLGKHGDVALRTIYPNIASKVIPKGEALKAKTYVSKVAGMRRTKFYLGDMYHQVHREQIRLIGRINEDWNDIVPINNHDEEFDREDEDEDMKMFKLSKEAFIHFSSKLGYTPLSLELEGLPDFVKQYELAAGEYWLPQNLIPICREFFGKYDILVEISNDYTDSTPFISYFVFIFCAVLYNMRTTKMVDVTCKRVREWLTLLRLVEEAGFDIGFISNKIKLVWEAHFLIKAKTIVDDTSRKLEEEAMQLSELEQQLLEQLEETREKIEKNKKQREDHYKYVRDGMKDLRKEQADVLSIKWKPVISVFNII